MIYKGTKEILSQSFRLPDTSTAFQAEVTAINKVADAMRSLNDGTMKYIKIFIDSQAAISAVGNPRVNSHAVASAVDSLNQLVSEVLSVTLVWIPAHKGHVGNERADVQAKKESQNHRVLFK